MWAKNSVILVAYLGLCYAFPGKKRRFFSKHLNLIILIVILILAYTFSEPQSDSK